MDSQLCRVLPTVQVTETTTITPSGAMSQVNVDVSLFQREAGDPAPAISAGGMVELPLGVELTIPPTENLGLNLYLAAGQVNVHAPETLQLKPVDGSFVSLPVPALATTPKAPFQFELGSFGWQYPGAVGSSASATIQVAGFLTISNLECDPGNSPLASPGGLLTSPCEWHAPGKMRFWSAPRAVDIDLWQRNLMDYMMKLLTERGYSFTSSALVEIKRDIDTRLSYLREDLLAEIRRKSASDPVSQNYTLPDGQVITIGDPRFTCPEIIFKPSLIGLREGLPGLLQDTDDIPMDMPALRRYISEHQALAVTLHDGFVQLHRPVSG